MKNGDVVFFKIAQDCSHARKNKKVQFKGMGFGVLLGHVPPFAKDPPPEQLLKLMGTIGFLSFDDVAEFLGDEFGAKCVKAFEDKYYGKLTPVMTPQPSGLIDSTGQEILPTPPILNTVKSPADLEQ